MKSRLGSVGLALVMVMTLVTVVPAQAAEKDTTSTTGIHLLTVPHDRNDGPVRQTASAINDQGWIAVGNGVLGNHRLWQGSGYPVDICPGCDDIVITGINNSDVVVGYFKPLSGDKWHGFVWTESGGLVDILPPGAFSIYDVKVVGVDEAGRIAVAASCSTACSFIGIPDTGGYSFTDIPRPLGNIKQPVDIGGGIVAFPDFVWDPTNGIRGINGGSASAINEAGQIAGYVTGTEEFQTHAAYWPTPDSAPTIIALDSDTYGWATGINDDGWVIGWSSIQRLPDENRDAFIYKPGASPELIPLGDFTFADSVVYPPAPGEPPEPINAWADPTDINNNGVVAGGHNGRAVVWDSLNNFDINYPPEISFSDPTPVVEGQTIIFSPTIVDPDGEPFTVDYQGFPTAATWDPNTGVLTWPTVAGDHGTWPGTMTVTQVGDTTTTITVDVTFTVDQAGLVFDPPIGNKTVAAGETLSFTVHATGDPNPEYEMFWETPPPGASLGLATGMFTWTPTLDEVGAYTVEFVAFVPFDPDNPDFTPPAMEIITIDVTDGNLPDTVTITVGETIAVGDTVQVTPPIEIVITESIGVSDTVTVRPPVVIQVAESIGVTDEVAVRPPVLISIVETVGVSDDVTTTPTLLITISESVGVTDTVTVTPPVVITIAESIGVSDEIVVTPGPMGSIFGIKWEDLNGDGTRDTGEEPLEDVVVYLDLDDDGSFDTGEPSTSTDAKGEYSFSNLTPGEWIVREVVPDGYTQTFPSIAQDHEHRLAVNSSESVTGVDFGNQPDPNLPPEIEPIDDVVLNVGEFVEIAPVITDPEGDPFTYEWAGYPPSAVINGVIPYIPLPEEAGMVFNVTLTVTQVGNPANVAVETFSITVNEQNEPAAIAPIGDVFALVGEAILVVPDVSDLEGDPYTMSWEGSPPNAVINGVFFLTPTADQAGEAFPIVATVIQNDIPVATEIFTVFVGGLSDAPDGVPVIPPVGGAGETIPVSGSGFNPGSEVGIFLFSDPILLGTVILGSDGSFNTTVEIPLETSAGQHTIVVMGVNPDGNLRVLEGPLEVTPVNDPPVVAVDVSSQTVQYSDEIAPIRITVDDIDSTSVTATAAGLPAGVIVTGSPCTVPCELTLSGTVTDAAGTYDAIVGLVDDGGATSDVPVTIIVEPEDASMAFHGGNPVAVRVASDGGMSGPFELMVRVSETEPDAATGTPVPGDLALVDVAMQLVSVGPGGNADPVGACERRIGGDGYDQQLTVICTFDEVAVNAYSLAVTVDGGYYEAAAEDVVVVYDPSLGYTTGGGSFLWPGTGEVVNFGYTMEYNKKGKKVKGSLLLIRHLEDGSIYRVKSNALYGLALGEDTGFGWASFSGKATYLEPGMLDPEGNHDFIVYVEDRDEPGEGVDRFWIEVRDKADAVIPALSISTEASDNAVPLEGGNVVVPHDSG